MTTADTRPPDSTRPRWMSSPAVWTLAAALGSGLISTLVLWTFVEHRNVLDSHSTQAELAFSVSLTSAGVLLSLLSLATFIAGRAQHRAFETLRDRERLLEETGALAQVGGWEFDPITGEGQWTPEVARIHDLDPLRHTTKDIGLQFYEGPHRQRIEAAVDAAIAHGTPYDLELELTTASGRRKWVRTICRPVVVHGRVVRVRGVILDITEQRRGREAQHDKAVVEQRLSTLAATSPGVMYSFHVSPNGRATFPFVTERIRDIFGLEPGAVAEDAELALSRIHADDIGRIRASIARSAETLSQWSEVFRYSHPGKGTIWVEGRSTPSRDADGSVLWHGFLLDVTDRRLLEEQYRQSQKMEAIGRLAGGVAHDFNNLLTVILGHASTMPLTTTDPDTLEQAREIAMAAERAAGLTRQLLLFSRKQVMRPVGINLNETIGAVTRMLQRIIGEDISLHADFAPGLPAVHADPGMIEQVLLNLAVNSRDAMPSGGDLTLSTRNGVASAHQAQGESEGLTGPFVCLSVRDTGTGIAPEVLPRIFEPFFTTKEAGKGTGLGLATVYGIIRQHGGWMVVDSAIGRGTTFHLYLPAMVVDDSTATEPPPLPGLARGTETILVVEDEPAVQRLTAAVLTRCGYTVHVAASGVTALEAWRAHGPRIDLVLTDMVMPEGMTGPELATRLRADRPDVKVVFTSGYSADIVGGEIARDPRVYFLPKPFQPERLAEIVRHCLDGRPPD